jgi:AcrR family transcriptional regulator
MSTQDTSPITRGDATREALLGAAIEVFGRDGYDAASTRSIAQAAGVNQALIGYHFRGKAGLYHAALEHIVAQVRARLGALVEEIEAELEAKPARGGKRTAATHAVAQIHRITDAYVAMLAGEASSAWARLILREQQNPSAEFAVLYDGFMKRALGLASRLVALARGTAPEAPETRLTVLTIFGQALVFRAARATVMRQMNWKSIGADEIERIQTQVRRNVSAMLGKEGKS